MNLKHELKHEMMCLYIDGFVIYVKYTNACIWRVCVSMNIWEWRCDCCGVCVCMCLSGSSFWTSSTGKKQQQSNNLKTTHQLEMAKMAWPFVSFTLACCVALARPSVGMSHQIRIEKTNYPMLFFVYCLLLHSFTCSIRALITKSSNTRLSLSLSTSLTPHVYTDCFFHSILVRLLLRFCFIWDVMSKSIAQHGKEIYIDEMKIKKE